MRASEAFGRRTFKAAPPSSRDTFNLGLLIPTSGVQGMLGPAAYACARLASEIWNDEGGVDGRTVKLTLVNSSAQGETLKSDLNQLLALDPQGRRPLDAMIAACNTADCRTISQIVDARVPMIYTPHFEGGNLPSWVHAIGETPDRQLLPALDWMAHRHHVRRWYLLGQDYCWPRRTHQMAIEHLRGRGDEIVADRYVPLGHRDYASVVEHIGTSGADAVLISLVGADSVHMCREFGRAGLSDRILRLSVAIEESALLGMGHENTAGMYIAHGYFGSVDTNANGVFRERYHSRFGARAPTLSGNAQSVYEGFVHLRRQTQDREPPRIASRLKSVRGASDARIDPIYLAQADGLGLKVIGTLAG